ncbi:fungal-specific transcription factor domain-containing protein [Tricharina praecox]|uniref:fungal-specific transcription factor domain-containing protein n=1 Tax=Tricharina praecox TaxID=43433 RepID=UPI00221E4117|nr:fungal-specific transcription factor domain-containing protein [Tricharina praecox]KAI5848048.1 fungal-specific transcription factor domain-containing protein [Tricharina praecox]
MKKSSTSSTPRRVGSSAGAGADTRAKGSDADGKVIPFEVGPVPKEYVTALKLDLAARNVKIEALEKQVQDLQGQVDALRGLVSWWEGFVRNIAGSSAGERDIMLSGFRSGDNPGGGGSGGGGGGHFEATTTTTTASPVRAPGSSVEERSELPSPSASGRASPPPTQHPSPGTLAKTTGQIRTRGALSRFYGPTSYQIATASVDPTPPPPAAERRCHKPAAIQVDGEYDYAHSLLAPQSEDCRRLMSLFFLRLYPYHMYFYREFFLRDLHAGNGPYYSDLLMYAICAMAALVSKDAAERQRSELFARRAQELLYNSGMDSPDITVLQALLLMSQREIGQGNGSKGWLFAGMAFRLAHDMGLHLDPRNWDSSEESSIEREIRRRCYWGAFVADKWISLYFGRPPALSPRESDVRETKRIQYPACWPTTVDAILEPGLINDLFSGKKTPQDEDGAALVGTLLCAVDLTKIVHKMLTNVFEIRDQRLDEASMVARVTEIHLELTSWLSNLPKKVHWNEWRSDVEPYTLVLHMMYHTVLIVLHRPPLSLQFTRTPAITPDFAICWSSVTAIIKLIKQYSRGNEYLYLPVTFVHTATAAASIILLKRHIVHEALADDEASKFLNVILSALGGCAATYPAAAQAKQAILMADEEARMRMVNFHAKEEDADVQAVGRELEQFFDLDFDSDMGGMGGMGGMGMGMGMGIGGVAGWMDPEWWDAMDEGALTVPVPAAAGIGNGNGGADGDMAY